jgi:hypothetical protein
MKGQGLIVSMLVLCACTLPVVSCTSNAGSGALSEAGASDAASDQKAEAAADGCGQEASENSDGGSGDASGGGGMDDGSGLLEGGQGPEGDVPDGFNMCWPAGTDCTQQNFCCGNCVAQGCTSVCM